MEGMKVGTSCLNLSQHSVPHSSSSTQMLASVMSSPSRPRSLTEGFLRCAHTNRSPVFGFSSKFHSARSCEMPSFRGRTIRRGCSSNMEAFSDEEFSKIQELAMRFPLSDAADSTTSGIDESELELGSEGNHNQDKDQSPFHTSRVEPPDWQDIILQSIERKANSVSLRMIKKKKQWKEGFVEVG